MINENINTVYLDSFLNKFAKIDFSKGIKNRHFFEFQKNYGIFIYNSILKRIPIITKLTYDFDFSDLYYEICIRLIYNLKNLKIINHVTFCRYISVTVKNRIIDEYRKIKSSVLITTQYNENILSNTLTSTKDEDDHYITETVTAAVNKLPSKHKEIIRYKYYQGLSASEIANILNLSERSVFKRLLLARKLLKEILIEIDPEIKYFAGIK